jgi:hypothetical protein
MSNNSFKKIKLITLEINNSFNGIEEKINYMKNTFLTYINKPNQDDNSKINLDILNYQSNLIKLDFNNNKELYNIFINQMYGHYYKLNLNFCILINEINKVSNLKIIIKDFKIYKDLKNDYNFSIDESEEIFNYIDQNINIIQNFINYQNKEIEKDKFTKNSGFYLNNFINKKTYDIQILNEKIKYYNNNLINYYNFHYNYLKRIHIKLNMEKKYINNNINSNNNNNNKNLLEIINKYKILNNIKKSDNLLDTYYIINTNRLYTILGIITFLYFLSI